MTTPPKTFKEKCEESFWKTLWEKPKYYWYIRQNSSKPNGKIGENDMTYIDYCLITNSYEKTLKRKKNHK